MQDGKHEERVAGATQKQIEISTSTNESFVNLNRSRDMCIPDCKNKLKTRSELLPSFSNCFCIFRAGVSGDYKFFKLREQNNGCVGFLLERRETLEVA